jgi:hypothetical protein
MNRWPFLLPFALLCVFPSPFASAESVRVTSWNVQGLGTNGPALEASAGLLQTLTPDIILLQGVQDWQMCRLLAEALKPAHYHVLICSSFPRANSAASLGQVGILAKSKAYFSWAEAWGPEGPQSGGGFAFVALETGGQRLGFFSASLGNTPAPNNAVRQLLEQANTVLHWEANRVRSLVIGISCPGATGGPGDPNSAASLLQEAGYSNGLQDLAAVETAFSRPQEGRPAGMAEYLLVQTSIFPSQPSLPATSLTPHPPLSCRLELDATKVAAAWTARAQELERRSAELRYQQRASAPATNSNAASTPAAVTPSPAGAPAWLWAAAGASVPLFVLTFWFAARSRQPLHPSRALLPSTTETGLTSSYTVMTASPSDHQEQRVIPQAPHDVQPGLPTLLTHSLPWQQGAPPRELNSHPAEYILRKKLSNHLARWLKLAFIRKLIGDREQLLATQHEAALKAINVDQRLARIEKQIQEQTASHELRLQELTRQLLAAREENRELIRARIAQVKLEMEAVRARMLAAANNPNETSSE